jgi:hypothetical protein
MLGSKQAAHGCCSTSGHICGLGRNADKALQLALLLQASHPHSTGLHLAAAAAASACRNCMQLLLQLLAGAA